MALSIKNGEPEELARELASATGESLTAAIVTLLRERLERLRRQRQAQSIVDQLDEIALRAAALPALDRRTPEEIAGYDEDGLPRQMVIDTSAIVAILGAQAERRDFIESIAASPVRLISAATLLEAGIVMEARQGELAGRELDLFLRRAAFEIVPTRPGRSKLGARPIDGIAKDAPRRLEFRRLFRIRAGENHVAKYCYLRGRHFQGLTLRLRRQQAAFKRRRASVRQ